jgi:hypothetical protein
MFDGEETMTNESRTKETGGQTFEVFILKDDNHNEFIDHICSTGN